MPRVKSLTPSHPVKVYISQENMAKLALVAVDPERKRAVFGKISETVNDALAYYFSDERKEYLQWKASKQQPV